MEVSLLTPWLKAFDSVALSRVEWGIKRGVKVGTKYHIGVSHKVQDIVRMPFVRH